MGIERSAWKLIASAFGSLLALATFAGAGSTGCANQTPVLPMLTVQPNAGARIFYLERRAQAMFGKPEGEGKGEGEGEGEGEGAPEVQETTCAPRAPRTWGAPSGTSGERTPCDSQ